MKQNLLLVLALATVVLDQPVSAAELQPTTIFTATNASFAEQFAAKEIRRYVYLRTGRLLPAPEAKAHLPAKGECIVVSRHDGPLATALAADERWSQDLAMLPAQSYWLKTVERPRGGALLVTGGDDAGVLYGAYRLAEKLGARFYLHGDVLPDERIALRVPALDEKAAPVFALRGIQPFHDFPEGPDWWNRDDYRAVISQLPKLGMNFFGLHTYPEGGPNAEPAVWIGPPQEIASGSQVQASYPSSWMNTRRGNWGYAPKRTSDYSLGAAALFPRDDFGAECMGGFLPQPTTPADENELFNRAGDLLRDAFSHARRLEVKTCVGTETPLVVPKAVQERLKEQGKKPADLAVVKQLYEGIFRRAAQAYPLDYYWFWTPEGWTWDGTKQEQIAATTNDLAAAIAAYREVKPPFALATCGWVLGPQQDRALFDKILPKEIAVSCINRQVGNTPVDPGFAEVSGRRKWAIPWLEDDPGLTAPQLWAGRMRRDAYDARRYGCDGLMGIHWRTRVLGPTVAALAQAAWRQGGWAAEWYLRHDSSPCASGPVGGTAADFPGHRIAGTPHERIYQTVRYNLAAYHLPVSNGLYTVTLQFCEPHYDAAGKRVFGVTLQGAPVIEKLDIFAQTGLDKALDYTFERVAVTNGWLDIGFTPIVEFPSIAGLVVQGVGASLKIDCGGAGGGGYSADWPSGPAKATFPDTKDFYADWARHEFGPEIGAAAADIFARMDGLLPRPVDWVGGPGGIKPDLRSWREVRVDYAFVDELAALTPEVRGAGNRERFDWWLTTFRYLQSMAEVNCAWGRYNAAFTDVKSVKDATAQRQLAQTQLLPLRRELVRCVGELYDRLLATVSNPGELGTVMNWEQHNFPGLLVKPGEELAKLLGTPLPADAELRKNYRGPARLIVPTVRTSVASGEALKLTVLVLAEQPPRALSVSWRPLGGGRYAQVAFTAVARGVHTATLPAAEDDFEYFIRLDPAAGQAVFFPASSPAQNQTVVVEPLMKAW
jgi:hypothetical protein